MQSLTITAATSTHQHIILEILLETQAWLWAQGINQWTLPFEAEWINKSVEDREFFVASVENEIVAVFRLTLTDSMWADTSNEAFYIHSLAVRLRWRGHNIGRHILQWIEAHAIRNQRRWLRLDCMAENSTLCGYYEQIGFKKSGIKKIQYEESFYRAQLFEKELNPLT